MIRILKKLLAKYCWVYERIDGDKGFVLARNYNDAVNRLKKVYDNVDEMLETEQMFIFDTTRIDIDGTVFITMPW